MCVRAEKNKAILVNVNFRVNALSDLLTGASTIVLSCICIYVYSPGRGTRFGGTILGCGPPLMPKEALAAPPQVAFSVCFVTAAGRIEMASACH